MNSNTGSNAAACSTPPWPHTVDRPLGPEERNEQ
jgi:hypothetical protein